MSPPPPHTHPKAGPGLGRPHGCPSGFSALRKAPGGSRAAWAGRGGVTGGRRGDRGCFIEVFFYRNRPFFPERAASRLRFPALPARRGRARARTAHALPASRAAPPARMRKALSARHCARAMPGETLCACAEGAARAPCAPSVCACAPAEGRPRYRPRVPRRSVTVRDNGEACRGTAGSFGVTGAFRAGGAAGSPVREGPREAPDPLRSHWSLPPSSARHFLPLATGRSAAPRLAQPAVRAPHAIGRPSACGRGLS